MNLERFGRMASSSVILVERSRNANSHKPHPVLLEPFVSDLLRGHEEMSYACLDEIHGYMRFGDEKQAFVRRSLEGVERTGK